MSGGGVPGRASPWRSGAAGAVGIPRREGPERGEESRLVTRPWGNHCGAATAAAGLRCCDGSRGARRPPADGTAARSENSARRGRVYASRRRKERFALGDTLGGLLAW